MKRFAATLVAVAFALPARAHHGEGLERFRAALTLSWSTRT